jgi:hypothetical protein
MPRMTWFLSFALALPLAAGVTVYARTPTHTPTHMPARGEMEIHDPADPVAAALQLQHLAVITRMEYKEQLIAGMIERRYRLDEVAREFLKCMEGNDVALNVLRLNYRGSGDEARAAQNVIDYVRSQSLPKAEVAAAVKHFEAEFRRLYPAD